VLRLSWIPQRKSRLEAACLRGVRRAANVYFPEQLPRDGQMTNSTETLNQLSKLNDRLVIKTEAGKPVHYWRLPISQSDLDMSKEVGATIGGYFIDLDGVRHFMDAE
jgi:hypothetical protein